MYSEHLKVQWIMQYTSNLFQGASSCYFSATGKYVIAQLYTMTPALSNSQITVLVINSTSGQVASSFTLGGNGQSSPVPVVY